VSEPNVPRKCPVDVAFKSQSGTAVALVCGSWNCPTCSKLLAREWARIAKYGVDHIGETAWFWTLTMSRKVKTREKAFEIMPTLWNSLRMAVQRASGLWLYIAFVEGQPHRAYMPHFHVLGSVPSWRDFAEIAVAAGFGYQAKEKPITSDGAAGYVSKYASKQGWDAPRGFRRVRASRKWPRPPDEPKDKYLVRSNSETLYGFLERVANTTHRDVGELYEDYRLTIGDPIDAAEWMQTNKIDNQLDEL